jgi:cytochrome c-type biogenesis protein CcmH/NrfF
MVAMRQPRIRRAALSLGVLCLVLAGTALVAVPAATRAQGMAPAPTDQTSEAELEINRRARALTDQMMSPWCKGVTVTQCSSGIAVSYREQIRVWLRSGVSEADIKRGFAQQFGENQFAMPRGSFSWTAPLVMIGLGAVLLVVLVRRVTATPPENASGPQLSADQYRKLEAELDSELRRRKV